MCVGGHKIYIDAKTAFDEITSLPMYKVKTNAGKRLFGASVKSFYHSISLCLPQHNNKFLLDFSNWDILGMCLFCKRHNNSYYPQTISAYDVIYELMENPPSIYDDGILRTHCTYCDRNLYKIMKKNDGDIAKSIDILLAENLEIMSRKEKNKRNVQ